MARTRVPLRTKLVAAVLALLTAAIVAIGVVSSIALRSYLIGRIDTQLIAQSHSLAYGSVPQTEVHTFIPPTSWIIGVKSVNGFGPVVPQLPPGKQPPWPHGIVEVLALPHTPYTVASLDGSIDWRMLAIRQQSGTLLFFGQSLSDVEHAIGRLIAVELIVGAATLVVMSAVGAGLIRASFRPLTEMEATAAAIAAGDLSRRVPEYEPGVESPRTEVGALSRALNGMLDQIEQAFAARATSEEAARAAAADARDAADAAHRSEVRARRSEERMRRFAADASHELRTPLTTIRGFAELYRQGAARTPHEAARLMRRIEDEASRMGLLVDDLLLLARLDRERPLALEPVDLRVVAYDAVTGARAVAPDRTIELDVAAGAGSLVVVGDELRLRQVVGNLMTNALTHTTAGTEVSLRLAADGGDGHRYAELAVVDHGPGLAGDQIGRVFERFYQVDAARTRRVGRAAGGDASAAAATGSGLGLAIVAAIVAAHDGTVEVTETPGGGATFLVRLPISPVTSDDDDTAG